ncbi:MAG: GDP-mannose 4,6-dehydratase [Syntrophobacteraceae bacterium]|nr:GDP-mannose 4,6-dehydratase [Syntrophobacteraceae bacterium]
MQWDHYRVLVTGAGGFIGSHLTERLVVMGARTRALVHYNSNSSWGWLDRSAVKDSLEVVAGDIRDQDSLRMALKGIDIVFHLAALIAIPYSYQSPLGYIRTNVEGTLNVLRSALDAGARLVVHTSTSEVYGTAVHVPIDEEHRLRGQSPYSASKIGADKIAEAFHLSFGLPVATVRPFNTYGPRQSARAIVPTIITQARTEPALSLGNLEATRDFNYVADTVEGFISVAECPEAVGTVINIGSGREISIGALAALILELLGADIPIVSDRQRFRPEGSEVDRLCASNGRARQMAGWQPRHSLKEGLGETIEWISDHMGLYRPAMYTI